MEIQNLHLMILIKAVMQWGLELFLIRDRGAFEERIILNNSCYSKYNINIEIYKWLRYHNKVLKKN